VWYSKNKNAVQSKATQRFSLIGVTGFEDPWGEFFVDRVFKVEGETRFEGYMNF
jgi:hypothetical protein